MTLTTAAGPPVDELAGELDRFRPQPQRVEALRLTLGITGQHPVEEYGPPSALSETLLWRGYRNADVAPEDLA